MRKKRETLSEHQARLESNMGAAAAAGMSAAVNELRRLIPSDQFPKKIQISVDINGVKVVG